MLTPPSRQIVRATESALVLLCGAGLLAGCGPAEPIDTAPPPAPPSLSLDASATDAPLAPDEIPIIPIEVPAGGAPDSGHMAAFLTEENRDLFEDEEGRVVPHTGLEILQRAAEAYQSYRYTAGDDDVGWPPLTDLSLLVKYRVLPGLPAAPSGQKFVLDPQTQQVSLVPQ